jgi:glucose-fructose oxidoreductase
MCAATLRFPGERLGSFICSFGAGDVSSYRIVGTKGDLRMEPACDFANGLCHHLTVGGRRRRRTFATRDQFAPELIYFSKCIQDGEEPEPSGREGLADVRIIRALYASAERGGQPVDLGPFDRDERPSARNELRKPAVAKPGLVHARAPSGRS